MLALCCSLGYKPVLRRGTQLHIELLPSSVPACSCQSVRFTPCLGRRLFPGHSSSANGRRSVEPSCSCSPAPLQHIVEAIFGEKHCASNCNPICPVEIVGSYAPSQRRPRLSCVVKPMGHRSGALLLVRGPAADVVKLCRGGPEAVQEIARGGALTETLGTTGSSVCSDDDVSKGGIEQPVDGNPERSERGAEECGRASRATADAAHVRQVLLAAQQFSLEGWRPVLFAARALSAEELSLYIQLSEEASNSMYRHEERHEQVITSFEADLQVSWPELFPIERVGILGPSQQAVSPPITFYLV